MYRKKLMRACLAAIMTATVVTTSVPVNAAEPVVKTESKQDEVKTKTIYVSYVDEDGMPIPNAIEKIEVSADANNFNASLLKEVPEGYELVVSGDIECTNDTINVKVRKKAVKPATKKIYVSYIEEDGTPIPNAIETIEVSADANNFNASLLKEVPEGYELVVTGDIECVNDTINVKVRKIAVKKTVCHITFETPEGEVVGTAVAETEAQGAAGECWTFMLGTDFKLPEGYKLAEGVDQITNIPMVFGTTGGHVMIVEEIVNEKPVYVSYIDEETKMPLENAIETIVLGKGATYFNTSVLKEVPEGYELCDTGDVYIGENDTVNVEVRKVKEAETKTVYVSYIDEETKIPFENGIEKIELEKGATYFNTSVLKEIPEGYELCNTGDVYIGENDTVNVEVRKVKETETKTVYVSYIDEETKIPFENGIEKIELEKGATYFNTSVLKEIPEGYELCNTGDVYIGENDTVNVEVRKIKEEIPWTPIDPAEPVDPEKPVNPEKPETPIEDEKDKDNKDEDNKKGDDKKKDDKKKAPKTSDAANPFAAAVPVGVSLAVILGLVAKKFKKEVE